MALLGYDKLGFLQAHKILQVILVILTMGGIGAQGCFCESEGSMDYQRHKMVEQQINNRGVGDETVIAAMLKVKRHLFVPEELRSQAYEDYPLPIGEGQTISQPYIVAFMTEALNLSREDKVLEIGTGSGYQAAVLAEIVKEVFSIEIIKELAERAQKTLQEIGYRNIYIRHGDGFLGWPEEAPFDAIIVTAAPNEVPSKLVDQLKVGGRMVIPVGSFSQDLYLIKKTEDGYEKQRLLAVRFVPMVKGKKDL